MCQVSLRPSHRFHRLRYFTALVKARPYDPDQLVRQEAYLRAIRTIPDATLHFGYYLSHEVEMPLASDPRKKVRVIKTEEKGSDVNLATHLLVDPPGAAVYESLRRGPSDSSHRARQRTRLP